VLADRVASPSDLAEELSAPLGNVAYHVRILERLGLLKLVKKRPRRGAIEHYYQARGRVSVSDRAWGQVPNIVKESMVHGFLDQVARYVGQASEAGGFERGDAHLIRQPFRVDEQGWRELATAVAELLARAEQIESESAARLKRVDHEGELEAALVLMLFEAALAEAAPPGDGKAAKPSRRSTKRQPA
jgi:Helix-turn-helix domain